MTVVGHAPPRALPVLQRALEREHAASACTRSSATRAAGRLARTTRRARSTPALERELARARAARVRRARLPRLRARGLQARRGGPPALPRDQPAADLRARRLVRDPRRARGPRRTTTCSPRCSRTGLRAARARHERARDGRRSARDVRGVARLDLADAATASARAARARALRRADRRRGARDRRARRALPLRDHALLRVADGPARSRVPDPPPGGAARSPSSTIRPASPIRSTRSRTRR